MNWLIILIRAAIWLTFFLLIVGEIAAIFWAKWFVKTYICKHKELEVRDDTQDRRLTLIEKHLGISTPETPEEKP